ncbi:TetR/AcrR family transcriptional regulator [Brevibacterium sp.]|uniref:TetR/AcrR family transcriptional regulator n=1 Tax=Brevibacterium sp. TaxID=1701 RepID=UPI0026493BA4|nr:TetR/AcrR family transcriptional regulator [Brevibacterium sp.]MDN6605909.1 TetR/AcrR family transcriptional regulator [Brevibacterium sp.]
MTQATSKGRPLDDELTGRVLNEVRVALEINGFVNLRIEKIAGAVGCSKTAIYRRWPSKAELVAAAVLDGIDPGDAPDTGDIVDDLVEHAWQHLTNFRRDRSVRGDGSQGGSRNGILLSLFDVEVMPLISERYMKQRHAQGREILQRAVTRGQISSDVDQDLTLDAIAGFTLFRLSINPDAQASSDADVKDSYRRLVRSLLNLENP